MQKELFGAYQPLILILILIALSRPKRFFDSKLWRNKFCLPESEFSH